MAVAVGVDRDSWTQKTKFSEQKQKNDIYCPVAQNNSNIFAGVDLMTFTFQKSLYDSCFF